MPNDVFNDDPQWVDLNNYFTELSDKVGLSSDQFRLLVENTYYLKNHLGLADVDVGGVVARYGAPGTEPTVTILHREETEAGKTTDYFDYLFTLPAATVGATATARAGNSAAVSVTPTPVYNEDEQVIGYNFAFDFTLPKGDKGDAGITPHIYNGNWWIGQTDTGVTAKGNVWYKGSEPLANVGANGDMFLKTNGDVYQKENGVWSYYTNIKGPKGDPGDTSIEDGSVTYSKLSTELQSSIDDIDNKVDKVTGKGLSTNDYTTEEKQKLAGIVVPTKTSDLTNDSGFITKAVADLANYYLKNETYTKTEIGNLISAIPKFSIKVVNALPVTDISDTTVYLVRNTGSETQNLYDEYIYVNDGTEQAPDWKWEKLGSQTLDLSGYLQKTGDTMTGDLKFTNRKTLYFSDKGSYPVRMQQSSEQVGFLDIFAQKISGGQNNLVVAGDTIYPRTDASADLGRSGQRWNYLYVKNGFSNGTKTILISDIVKATDLATVATSGSFNDLTDKPTSVVVDSALSSTSENPVQNKVINTALNDKLSLSGGTMTGSIVIDDANKSLLLKNPSNTYSKISGGSSDGSDAIILKTHSTSGGGELIINYRNLVMRCLQDPNLKPILGSSTNLWDTLYAETISNGTQSTSVADINNYMKYTTTAPTAINTSGLKIALLDSEPATKYDGWIYLIKES